MGGRFPPGLIVRTSQFPLQTPDAYVLVSTNPTQICKTQPLHAEA